MSSFLLDTTVVVDWWRGREAVVAWLALRASEGSLLHVSAVTVAESLAGVGEDRREMHAAQLRAFRYLPVSFAAAARAGELRWEHARRGQPVPLPDLLQASVALEAGCVVATSNPRHFLDVPTVDPRAMKARP